MLLLSDNAQMGFFSCVNTYREVISVLFGFCSCFWGGGFLTMNFIFVIIIYNSVAVLV